MHQVSSLSYLSFWNFGVTNTSPVNCKGRGNKGVARRKEQCQYRVTGNLFENGSRVKERKTKGERDMLMETLSAGIYHGREFVAYFEGKLGHDENWQICGLIYFPFVLVR